MNDNEKVMQKAEHTAEKVDETKINDDELAGVVGGFNGCPDGIEDSKEKVRFLFNVGDIVEVEATLHSTNRGIIRNRMITGHTAEETNSFSSLKVTQGSFQPLYEIEYTGWFSSQTLVPQDMIQKP